MPDRIAEGLAVMAHRAGNGWIAPLPDGETVEVSDWQTDEAVQSTGIFVHRDRRTVFLNFAGLPDGKQADDFRIPGSAFLLRELAKALELVAADIDQERERRFKR